MQISTPTVDFDEGTLTGKSAEVGIRNQDMSVIIQILTAKMYSNPLKIVVQEYVSNARDAHREIGKAHVPVQVKLPNDMDPNFSITDFGPGIDEKRMWDVFVYLGASTKRKDDNQTGGFGLGAKSAFSYTDQFTVSATCPDSKGNLMTRQYVCKCDKTKIVMQEVFVRRADDDEKQGTTISIPILRQDWHRVYSYLQEVCGHWTVKPEVKGGEAIKFNQEVLFEGKGWKLCKNLGQARGSLMLVDEIPYQNVNFYAVMESKAFTSLNDIEQRKISNMVNSLGNGYSSCFEIWAGTGEVAVSSDREKLDYGDPKTNATIVKILVEAQKFFEDKSKDIFKGCNTIAEANKAAIAFSDSLAGRVVGDMKYVWGNINVNGSCEVYLTNRWVNGVQKPIFDQIEKDYGDPDYFTKGLKFSLCMYRNSHALNRGFKSEGVFDSVLSLRDYVEGKAIIMTCFDAKINPRALTELFKTYNGRVCVIHWKGTKAEYDYWIKAFHFECLIGKDISTITIPPKVKSAVPRGQKADTTLVREWQGNSGKYEISSKTLKDVMSGPDCWYFVLQDRVPNYLNGADFTSRGVYDGHVSLILAKGKAWMKDDEKIWVLTEQQYGKIKGCKNMKPVNLLIDKIGAYAVKKLKDIPSDWFGGGDYLSDYGKDKFHYGVCIQNGTVKKFIDAHPESTFSRLALEFKEKFDIRIKANKERNEIFDMREILKYFEKMGREDFKDDAVKSSVSLQDMVSRFEAMYPMMQFTGYQGGYSGIGEKEAATILEYVEMVDAKVAAAKASVV